jgi:hypothetical protein
MPSSMSTLTLRGAHITLAQAVKVAGFFLSRFAGGRWQSVAV